MMGLFDKEKRPADAYAEVAPHLAARDGKLHVVMLRSYSSWTTTKFHCDASYVNEVDAVLSDMQDNGYEIVDVQHAAMSSGTGVGATTTTTLVSYR